MPRQDNQLLIALNESSVETNASWWADSDSHTRGDRRRWDSGCGNYEPSLADYVDDFADHTPYYVANLTLDTAFAVIGTLINGWFLAAMLTSPEIRSGMRSKLFSAMLSINLTMSAITLPLYIIREIMFGNYLWSWFNWVVPIALGHIQDFIFSWHIFIIVCFYTSQVVNFKPRFTPFWMTIFTVLFIISASVVCIWFVPVTMDVYIHRTDYFCDEKTFTELKVYATWNTIVPLSLASLLLVAVAVLEYRQSPYGRPCDTRCDQLIDDRFHIDPLYPYVALLVGVMVTDLSRAISLMNIIFFLRLGPNIWFYLLLVSRYPRYLRLILVPVMLLLFPDIRKRIKTWRPCNGSAPTPVDLVVTCEKNAS